MRDERVCERAAVSRLQDGCLDLDESVLVEEAADRRDHTSTQEEELARLLVHEQVEVALAVARLLIREAVERVGERTRVARQHGELVDHERGLPRRDLAGLPATPTTSPRRTSISPTRPVSHMSWTRPERSTRSRKASFPISLRAITRPASLRVSSSSPPASSPSVDERTSAIASRSGKRLAAVMARRV
jgi:hypothetical protein